MPVLHESVEAGGIQFSGKFQLAAGVTGDASSLGFYIWHVIVSEVMLARVTGDATVHVWLADGEADAANEELPALPVVFDLAAVPKLRAAANNSSHSGRSGGGDAKCASGSVEGSYVKTDKADSCGSEELRAIAAQPSACRPDEPAAGRLCNSAPSGEVQEQSRLHMAEQVPAESAAEQPPVAALQACRSDRSAAAQMTAIVSKGTLRLRAAVMHALFPTKTIWAELPNRVRLVLVPGPANEVRCHDVFQHATATRSMSCLHRQTSRFKCWLGCCTCRH